MKRFFVAASLTVALLLAVFLITGTGHAQDKVIKLKMATFVPATTIQGKLVQEYANEIEKRTNGRVKIAIYPANTLISLAQMYDGTTKRVADIGMGYFSITKNRFPMMEALDLPLGIKTSSATKLVNAYYKKFKPKELDDVKILTLEGNNPGALNLRKQIKGLEDLKGMKIRSHNISGKIVSALGAAPVGMPITDAYDAMSKGVIDGLMLEKGGTYNFKMTDLVKYMVENEAVGFRSTFFYVMNKTTWNGLPKDIQAVFDKVGEEWHPEKATAMWTEWEKMGQRECDKAGIKFIKLSAQENARWNAKVQPIIDEWIKETKAKGLPADEAVKFIRDWLKTNQK